jgi:hypothetical protein
LGFFAMASSSRRLLNDTYVGRLVVNLCSDNSRRDVRSCFLGIGKPNFTICRLGFRSGVSAYLDWTLAADERYPNAVVGGLSGGGGEEGFTGRAAIGYDHGYDGEVFYLGLALDPAYIEGWVEGCLERIGEDYPEDETMFRDLWEDETQWDVVIESLKADCEVRTGRPLG